MQTHFADMAHQKVAAACPHFGGSSRLLTLVGCCAHRNVRQTNVGAGGRDTNQQRANGDAHWRQVDAGCLNLDETGRDVERDGIHDHTCKSTPQVTRLHQERRGHSLACQAFDYVSDAGLSCWPVNVQTLERHTPS